MKQKLIFIFTIMILFSSCGGSKSAIDEKTLKTKTLKGIIKNYNKSIPEFKTMRGRIKANYDDGVEQQSINISYRFQRDKTIWMSAKLAGLFQVAKMMIKPEKIKFYERIENTYFEGDFQLISSFLGIELSFNQIQNMFLGQAVMPISISKTDFQTNDKYFQLVTTYEGGETQFLKLDAKTYKVKQQSLSKNDKQITIKYLTFQFVDGMSFPEEFVILAGDTNSQIKISLNYKNIKLNDDLRFPFSFPNNFSPINLN